MPEEIRAKAPLVLRAVPAHAADRHGTVIDNGVIIRRAKHVAKLIKLPETNYFKIFLLIFFNK